MKAAILLAFAIPGAALAASPNGQTAATGQHPVTAADLKPLEELRRNAIASLGITNAPQLDLDLIAQGMNALRLKPYQATEWAKGVRLPSFADIKLSPADMTEIFDLAVQATKVFRRVSAREAEHRRQLAARGVAEVPASTAACRFQLDAGGKSFMFDRWGELQIDRRFLDEQDMAVVRRMENCYQRILGNSSYASTVPPSERRIVSRAQALKTMPLPIFRGFEDDRYQMHDTLILKLTEDFNAHKDMWIGGSTAQAAKTGDLSPALVKAHMIEESGGNGPASLAAWRTDPLQVNVPGDWDDAKLDLGIKKPTKRNEGELAVNVRAAIMFLARKGFGTSGKAARMRPKGFFDGWPDALRRYNARRDRTASGRYYSDEYARKILARAKNPETFVPIEIKLSKQLP